MELFCSKCCSLFLAPENFVLIGYWVCNSFIGTLFWTTLCKCGLCTSGTWIKLCLPINIDMIMCARECMMFSCETFHCTTHGRQINYICDDGGIRPLTEICSQVPKPITTNHRLCQSDCDPFSDCLHLTRRAAYILQGGLCTVLQTQMDGKLSHRRSHQIGRWLCRVNTSWTGLVPYIADHITYIISWAITPIQSLSIIENFLTETNVSLKIWKPFKFLINWGKKPRYFTGIILEFEKSPWSRSTIVHNSW